MNNAELITALRQRSETKESELTFAWLYETQGAMSQAADALEAAEKRIVELNTKCADLQSQINSMGSEIEELLPKEG